MAEHSKMTIADAQAAFAEFSTRVERFGETSAAGMFAVHFSDGMIPNTHLNVQFLTKGRFGEADPVFEAVRVLSGRKLAAPDGQRTDHVNITNNIMDAVHQYGQAMAALGKDEAAGKDVMDARKHVSKTWGDVRMLVLLSFKKEWAAAAPNDTEGDRDG